MIKKTQKTAKITIKKKSTRKRVISKLKKDNKKAKITEEKIDVDKKNIHTEKNVYIVGVGRRKRAVARVRFYKSGNGEIIINEKELNIYFPYFEFQNIVTEPLHITNFLNKGRFTIKVTGGGIRGQAEGIRLGISKILIQIDQKFKPLLKPRQLLSTDARIKERKKYGLKKARRAPQWQKR